MQLEVPMTNKSHKDEIGPKNSLGNRLMPKSKQYMDIPLRNGRGSWINSLQNPVFPLPLNRYFLTCSTGHDFPSGIQYELKRYRNSTKSKTVLWVSKFQPNYQQLEALKQHNNFNPIYLNCNVAPMSLTTNSTPAVESLIFQKVTISKVRAKG